MTIKQLKSKYLHKEYKYGIRSEAKVANKHLDKLINGKYIESVNKELFLTSKGLKAFYDAKAKEFKQRSSLVRISLKSDLKTILYLLIVVAIIIVLIFAPQITSWFANL
ncbi:MAG: hypothetical protein ACFFEN_11815 [Candidatus Thorarchaeota archaeon]